jgi:hypothetical protein
MSLGRLKKFTQVLTCMYVHHTKKKKKNKGKIGSKFWVKFYLVIGESLQALIGWFLYHSLCTNKTEEKNSVNY